MWKNSSTDFHKNPKYQISRNLSSGSRADTHGEGDRWTHRRTDEHPVKRAPLWLFNIVGNNRTYSGLRVMFQIFLTSFKQIWTFSTHFHEVPNTKCHGNSPVGTVLIHADGGTDRQRDGHGEGNKHFS
jgi:hypothetical protein